jgi:hypothetical protein
MKKYVKTNPTDVLLVYKCPDCNNKAYKTADDLFYKAMPVGPVCNKHAMPMQIVEVSVRPPRIIAFVEGGVVHDVMADAAVQFRIIDYDVEGSSRYKKIKLPGSDKGETELVHIYKYNLSGKEDMTPFFKQRAIK